MTATRVSGSRVFLGLFILVQLAYLLSHNSLEMLRSIQEEQPSELPGVVKHVAPGWVRKKGHLHDTLSLAYQTSKRYGQITGQSQCWSLFAPSVQPQSIFPALVLRWDDEPPPARSPTLLKPLMNWLRGGKRPAAFAPLELRSHNEPDDINQFLRIGKFRFRRYEELICGGTLRVVDDETEEAARRRWRSRIADHVAETGGCCWAWMKIRLDEYQREHPGRPMPRQLILFSRRFETILPTDAEGPPYWRGPFVMPLARWQPGVDWPNTSVPLEPFDPVSGTFRAPPGDE